ncbi:MAG: glycerophosphodiester phosphodiesterase [Oscillospiraceae bacterium]|nr:glycerophosphodiester phosphodiesterase [Oscillospiraceae bacterium]
MKKCTVLALGAAAAALAIPAVMLAPGRAPRSQKAPFIGLNCAHRGLHSRDKSVPENSLEAFRRAADTGYGIELDVQLSRDGQVVVFHDDTLKRVCGVDARVDELDYDELEKLSLCGTEHRIPLFTQVLKLIDGRSNLIVELKGGRRNDELCEKVRNILDYYDGIFCVESFHPGIVRWFKKHAPDYLRGQLAMPEEDYAESLSPVLKFLLAHGFTNLIARPHFIAYKIGPRPLSIRFAELMGAMKVGWTSHDKKSERGRHCVIFEFYTPSVRYK